MPAGKQITGQRGSRRGIVTVWMALALTALCALLALALDIALLVSAKHELQVACDAAALAAATALPSGVEAVREQALHYYTENLAPSRQSEAQLQSDTGSQAVYVVGQDTVRITTPYSDSYTSARGWAPGDLVEVRAERSLALPFAALLGMSEQTVVARAVAYYARTTMPAIFARYEGSNKWGVEWTGSGGKIEGSIHSNTKVRFSGSGHHITGSIVYRYQLRITGSGHRIDGGSWEGSVEDFPLSITRSDIDPGVYDYVITGDFVLNGSGKTAAPGVYHILGDLHIAGSGHVADNCLFIVEGDAKINGSGHSLQNTTIYAEGRIDFSGSGHVISARVEDIALFSNYSGLRAIEFSGSGINSSGILYAPNGEIDFSGSGMLVQNGSLICQYCDVAGSGFTIRPTTGSTFGAGRLVE